MTIQTQAPRPKPHAPHRGTIFLEDAEVLAHERFEANQFILKLQAPKCAAPRPPDRSCI